MPATEVSGLPITRAASANQNVRNNTLRKNPEEWLVSWCFKWPPCLALEIKLRNRAKDGCTRVVDFKLKLQNNEWCTLTDDGRYERQSNKANCIHLNAAITLKPSCILSVSTVLYRGQIQSLLYYNLWEAGLRAQRGTLSVSAVLDRVRTEQVQFSSVP